MRQDHTQENFEKLQRLSVPTIANAIETFEVAPANAGFCNASMIDRFPDMPLLVGYAATCRVQTDLPPSTVQKGIDEYEFWDYVEKMPKPKMVVCQDVDTPAKGANWGEFYANVYTALGCSGAIVDGAVRDIDGVCTLGFRFFSTEVLPSHANGFYLDYGGQVRVAELLVNSGDLIVGDRNGVLLIPPEIPLDILVEVAEEIDALEAEVFALCKSRSFSLHKLKKLDASVNSRWPNRKDSNLKKGLK